MQTMFLLRCPKAISLWETMGIPISKRASFNLPILNWIRLNSESYRKHPLNIPWAVIFPLAGKIEIL